MDLLSFKKIHFIGIGGIGVSALARFFLARKVLVTGTDATDFSDKRELEAAGAKIAIGEHSAANMPDGVDAVIFSSAIPDANPELLEAKKRGILVFRYAEALGLLMEGHYGIGVSGTNGKTTTTAMLGKMLEEMGWDPLVVVGGKVPGWDKNIRLPKGEGESSLSRDFPYNIFLAEADEYRRHMLALSPTMIVLTNIEADHLDYYKDIDDIMDAFGEYVKKLSSENGVLVYNGDDGNAASIALLAPEGVRTVSYSTVREADVRARDITQAGADQRFEIEWQGGNLGVFTLPIPGRFNISNALAAAAPALVLGADGESIRGALAGFRGSWRRFERMGTVRHRDVISDYAHHPTAVRETIHAAKEFFPGKKILAVFQPHQKDRTRKFMEEFSQAFREADSALILEIYNVSGRDDGPPVSSKELVEKILADKKNPPVGYVRTTHDALRRIQEIIDPFDVVLIMGAGDVHAVAEGLVKKEHKHRDVNS